MRRGASPFDELTAGEPTLNVKSVFLVPALRAWMERHVARRRGSVLPELADAGERILPENLVLARGDRGADFVGVLVRQRRARVERPPAVVETVVIRLQMRIVARGNSHATPADRLQLGKYRFVERNGLEAGGERLLEP